MIVEEVYAAYPERRAVFTEYSMQLQSEFVCSSSGICINTEENIETNKEVNTETNTEVNMKNIMESNMKYNMKSNMEISMEKRKN